MMPLIPPIFKAIGVFLALAIPGIVARVLGFLGFGYVSYIGVKLVTNTIVDLLQSHFSNIPVKLLSLAGIAGFDVYISLIISTHIAGITFLFFLGGSERLKQVGRKR